MRMSPSVVSSEIPSRRILKDLLDACICIYGQKTEQIKALASAQITLASCRLAASGFPKPADLENNKKVNSQR